MANQDTDRYLLKLIEEVSYIKGAVSGLKDQVDKLDERIVDPFQEWLHNVKVHETNIKELKHNFKEFLDEKTKQDTKIKDIETQISSTKWYAAGAAGTVTFIVYCLYQLVTLVMPFFSH